jgi:hypothetical protein
MKLMEKKKSSAFSWCAFLYKQLKESEIYYKTNYI